MISHHHRHRRRAVSVTSAAQATQGQCRREQVLGRNPPDGENRFRPNELDLPAQPRRTARHFLGKGIPIVRRPAFHNVGNVDLFTGRSEREEHGIEESARTPHERLAPCILLGAGTLADDHERRGLRSHPEHGVGPSPMKGATRADFDHSAKRFMVCVLGIGGGFGIERSTRRRAQRRSRTGGRRRLPWDPERNAHRVQIAPAAPFPPIRPRRDGATRRVHPWTSCRCVGPPAGGGARPE